MYGDVEFKSKIIYEKENIILINRFADFNKILLEILHVINVIEHFY